MLLVLCNDQLYEIQNTYTHMHTHKQVCTVVWQTFSGLATNGNKAFVLETTLGLFFQNTN